MSLLVLLQLLMFVSVHACNARSLGVLDKLNDLKKETSIRSKMRPVVAQVVHDDKSKIEQDGATTKIHEDSETFFNGRKGKIAFSGIKSIVNSQIDMQQEIQLIQEMKKHGRSLGESKSDTTDEEAVESNENEIVEDVVVMDYASPHRKPPIHNEKP